MAADCLRQGTPRSDQNPRAASPRLVGASRAGRRPDRCARPRRGRAVARSRAPPRGHHPGHRTRSAADRSRDDPRRHMAGGQRRDHATDPQARRTGQGGAALDDRPLCRCAPRVALVTYGFRSPARHARAGRDRRPPRWHLHMRRPARCPDRRSRLARGVDRQLPYPADEGATRRVSRPKTLRSGLSCDLPSFG